MTPVTLFTLTIPTGTGTATYRYADVQTDAYPGYAPRLARGADLEEAAASPLTRSLPVRRARVALSNVTQPDYTATAPTVSEMLAAGAAVVGAQASVQVADADTQTVLTTIGGYVEELPALSLLEATLVVSDALAGDASTLLPHCALIDLFPSVQAPDGTALAVICGTARRVRLYSVSQDDVVLARYTIAPSGRSPTSVLSIPGSPCSPATVSCTRSGVRVPMSSPTSRSGSIAGAAGPSSREWRTRTAWTTISTAARRMAAGDGIAGSSRSRRTSTPRPSTRGASTRKTPAVRRAP